MQAAAHTLSEALASFPNSRMSRRQLVRQRVVAAVDPFLTGAVLLRVRDVVVLSSYMLTPGVTRLALLYNRWWLFRRSVLWVGRRDMLRLSSKTFPAVSELRRWAFGRRLVGRSHGAPPLRMPVV